MRDVDQMITEIRFHQQIHGDAKRTVYCQPSALDAIQQAMEDAGLGHLVRVVATPTCPEGRMLLVDEPALEASFNAAVQRSLRDLRRR